MRTKPSLGPRASRPPEGVADGARVDDTPAGVRHLCRSVTGGGASFGACHRLIYSTPPACLDLRFTPTELRFSATRTRFTALACQQLSREDTKNAKEMIATFASSRLRVREFLRRARKSGAADAFSSACVAVFAWSPLAAPRRRQRGGRAGRTAATGGRRPRACLTRGRRARAAPGHR